MHQHTIETAQYITDHEKTIPSIVEDILSYKADIVGFTCYDANYPYVRLLSQYLKKKNPLITIVLGGPTATFSPQLVMEHTPEIDVCIRGEGEETMVELVKKGFSDLEDIQGITFRSKTLVDTLDRPLISSGKKGAELDVLPSPYVTGFIPPDGKTGLLTGRGCVYHCTYCNFSTMFNHTIRYHSVDRVIAELELIAEHWDPRVKDKIMIQDDIFSLNLKRAKSICQKIIDKGIQLPLSLETRADNCDKELLELMKEAGVVWINFGLESACLPVLKTIKKAPDEKKFLKQIKTAVNWAKEAGIKTSVSVILGLPGEGEKEARKTLDFVQKLNVDEYYHNILFLFAGTELFRTRKEYGLDVVHSPSFLPYTTQYAYNAQKIEPLSNVGMEKQKKLWKKTYCDAVTYGKGKNAFTYLFCKGEPDMVFLSTWLHPLSALHLSVVDTRKVTDKDIHQCVATLLEGGVPVGFYSLLKGSQLTLHSQADLTIKVPEIPFCQWEPGLTELVTVETEKDIKKFASVLRDHTTDGILSFSAQSIPNMVVDPCKWGSTVCPALLRSSLVIDSNDVLSCYKGGCIGKVGDDITTLHKNVHDLLLKKEKERGCNICDVKNECSRCLYPYSFTDGKFCELKRAYPYISKVIPLLQWLYTYAGQTSAEVAIRIDENAPPLFYHGEIKKGLLPKVRDTVVLGSFNGDAFVFSGEKGFSLDSVKAAILEACILGIDKETLISSLDQEDCSLVDMTLFIFKELGLLI